MSIYTPSFFGKNSLARYTVTAFSSGRPEQNAVTRQFV